MRVAVQLVLCTFSQKATTISAYIDGELQNWIDIGMISESAVNAALDLPDKLKGLYSSLNNYPAVMNRRLLVGGSKPPVFDDDSLHVEVVLFAPAFDKIRNTRTLRRKAKRSLPL